MMQTGNRVFGLREEKWFFVILCGIAEVSLLKAATLDRVLPARKSVSMKGLGLFLAWVQWN